jgi:two-component system, sensor histidine kinase and response regulator
MAAWDSALGLERADGDKELLAEMIAIFFEDYPTYQSELVASLDADDFPALRKIAHTLKGSLANLGAVDAAALALAVEQACEAADEAKLRAALSQLMDSIDSMQPLMKAFSEEASSARES